MTTLNNDIFPDIHPIFKQIIINYLPLCRVYTWDDPSKYLDCHTVEELEKINNVKVIKLYPGKTLDIRSGFRNVGKKIKEIIGDDVKCIGDMTKMFLGNTHLTCDMSGWDVSSVTNMSYMFSSAFLHSANSQRRIIDLSLWDTKLAIDSSYMFSKMKLISGQSKTTIIDLSGWDMTSVKNMKGMFSDSVMSGSNLSRWKISPTVDMTDMFANAILTNCDTSMWDVSSDIDHADVFSDEIRPNDIVMDPHDMIMTHYYYI